jgi:hypothetical protein
MLESGLSGSVRGVPSDGHPYRDPGSNPLWRAFCGRNGDVIGGPTKRACLQLVTKMVSQKFTPKSAKHAKPANDPYRPT